MSQSDAKDGFRFLISSSQGPRPEQQDSGICLSNDVQGTALLVVGDGVGGRSGGRLASQKLTQLATELWEERKGSLAKPAEDLAMLCQVAHEHINSEGSKLGISPRTTIVALYLTPKQAFWVHSGDSRLYHFREGKLVERTEDHSLLEIMVQRGAVKEEDMGSHPDQNTLLQSLGGEEFVAPSSGSAEITPDDGFLLCTDGFWERTKPEEMAALVFAEAAEAKGLLADAVERAVGRNGPKGDNVTVAVALPARIALPARAAAAMAAATVMPVKAAPTRAALDRKQKITLLSGAFLLLVVTPILFFWPEEKKPNTAATPAAPVAIPPRAIPVEKSASTPPPLSPPQAQPVPVEKPPAQGIPPSRELPLPTDPPSDRSTPAAGPTPIAVPLHPFQPERAKPAEPNKNKPKDFSIRDSSLEDRSKPAE
ncbi:protein serine/threonine phosphatase [Chthoniobacter flavus Ellin428]|uniref:Protein serine/threonine phosphatase n=1 Tax=Chthoniobacter flavus Ellin428 TaxID=497964 RepID=B4DCQ9_9BACT|nr:PP2C family serine/threonine-protein phosphatase [Chthoniobacter flavus]EDY15772.1 protein serine/threonine phosphatase [Chthoniobacter flavus Ellin428]TCO89271.1 serine/threonine protein phosphatase PrpC [Chthoniobacter flavus]